MLGAKVKTFFVICQEASSRFALICFPLAACKFFFSPLDFFFSYKIFFITKFVTHVRKFVIKISYMIVKKIRQKGKIFLLMAKCLNLIIIA